MNSTDSLLRGKNGFWERNLKTGVIAWKAFQVCQPDFLPLPLKAEVVSQPVKAWKNGKLLAVGLPIWLQIELIWIIRSDWPDPNLIQRSKSEYPASMSWNFPREMVTMSVSTVRIIKQLFPSSRASNMWMKILESASSWEQGGIAGLFTAKTFVSIVTRICLFSLKLCPCISFARKWNNSFLFSLTNKKSDHLTGSFPLACTLKRVPDPRLSLTASFKLLARYLSKTRLFWSQYFKRPSRYGM